MVGDPVDVEFPYSVALPSDTELRVVLDLVAPADLPEEGLLLVLDDGRRRVRAPAELVRDHGRRPRLTATVPRSALGAGTWQLSVRTGDGHRRRVRARLLVVPDRPVALLPGPAPRSRVAPPRPRQRVPRQGSQRPAGPARRAARSALRRLPPDRAAQVRRGLGRVRATIRG